MLYEAMTGLRDRLTAGGVRAVLDERDLNPPGVLVRPPVLSYTFGGGGELAWQLLAVVPDTGTGTAVPALDVLIAQVQAALGGDVTIAAPAAFAAETGAPLPAYRLTLTTDI